MRGSGWMVGALALSVVAPAMVRGQDTKARTGDLSWKLAVGDEMRYAFTWLLVQKEELKGAMPPQERTFEVAYGLNEKVTAVGDGSTIEATIGSIRGRVALGMMGDFGYDSAQGDDPNNPMRWMRHLVGKKFTFVMKPTGEVTSVTGGDALRAEVTAAIEKELAEQPKPAGGGGGGGNGGRGGGEDDPMGGMGDPSQMAKALAGQLTVVFTDASLKSSLGVVNYCLPDEQKKENDTWSRPIREVVPQMGGIGFTALYTHRGTAERRTKITSRADGEIQFDKDQDGGDAPADGEAGDPMQDMMRQMQREMSQGLQVKRKAVTGTASWDSARQRLVDSELVHEIDLEGPIPAMLKAMMGEQAKDLKMTRAMSLTLRYVEQGQAGGF